MDGSTTGACRTSAGKRNRKTQRAAERKVFPDDAADPRTNTNHGQLDGLVSREQQALVLRAFASLCEREQTALRAVYDLEPQGPTVSQLAAGWSCSRQTVYNAAERARARLVSQLHDSPFET